MFYSWNHCVTVTKYKYNGRVPKAFRGYRILQLSDLHGDLPKSKYQDIMAHINDEAPDMVVITGDIIDDIHMQYEGRLMCLLQEIGERYPVYYVSGNHEFMAKECFDVYRKVIGLKLKLLRDESVIIERESGSLILSGAQDPYALYGKDIPARYKTPSKKFVGHFREVFEPVKDKQEFKILLSHRPEYFRLYCEYGFDIVFSGHAHGGQMRLPLLGGMAAPDQGIFPRYDAGEFKKDGTTMYVSRGLGNSTFPLRVFNKPEIVVLEL